VTVVPAFTVRTSGVKAKLSMLTVASSAKVGPTRPRSKAAARRPASARSQRLARRKAAGLVMGSPNPSDGRQTILSLTNTCREMIQANRAGYLSGTYTGYQLKIIQEVITLGVFVGFAWFVLKERLTWNYAVSFAFILLAVYFATAFKPGSGPQ